MSLVVSHRKGPSKMIMINERKRTIVKPAEKTPRRSLWLSILDRMNNHPVHNTGVQFYRPISGGAANFFDAELLKEALSKVLVHFYPLAGRYGVDEDGRINVDCNEEGVLFVEAESSSTIDDFGDCAPSQELMKLVPAVDYSGGSSSYFLLVTQVTYFKCGGAAVGIAIEHHMVDGPAAFHLLNSWSEIARGLDLSIPIFLDRTLLAPRDPPQPKFNHIEYQPPTSTNKKICHQNDGEEHHHVKTSVFKMTRDQLKKMKSHAKNYSTFEILTGHVWKCVCQAREQPYDQETTLYFPVGGRTRLEPNLPPGYFGNAHFAATSTALAGDLQSKPLSYAASLIHECLAKMTNDYLRSAIDYLAIQPDITALRRGPSTYQCPNLGITSWSNMGMHDADFGWGRPCYNGPAGIMFEGKSYILPSASGDGSLSLAIALREEHMTAFEKLFYEYA